MQIAISKNDGTYVLWVDGELKGKVIETSPDIIKEMKLEFKNLIRSLQNLHLDRLEKERFFKSVKKDISIKDLTDPIIKGKTYIQPDGVETDIDFQNKNVR